MNKSIIPRKKINKRFQFYAVFVKTNIGTTLNRSNQTPPTTSTVQKKKEKAQKFCPIHDEIDRISPGTESPINPSGLTGSVGDSIPRIRKRFRARKREEPVPSIQSSAGVSTVGIGEGEATAAATAAADKGGQGESAGGERKGGKANR